MAPPPSQQSWAGGGASSRFWWWPRAWRRKETRTKAGIREADPQRSGGRSSLAGLGLGFHGNKRQKGTLSRATPGPRESSGWDGGTSRSAQGRRQQPRLAGTDFCLVSSWRLSACSEGGEMCRWTHTTCIDPSGSKVGCTAEAGVCALRPLAKGCLDSIRLQRVPELSNVRPDWLSHQESCQAEWKLHT